MIIFPNARDFMQSLMITDHEFEYCILNPKVQRSVLNTQNIRFFANLSSDCPGPDDLKARLNEGIPGEVSALAVTFAQERQPGGGQQCVASATWMVPKGN